MNKAIRYAVPFALAALLVPLAGSAADEGGHDPR